MVLGSVENPFYGMLLQEVVEQAAQQGLRVLILHAGAGALEERTAEAILQYKLDGCLISSATLSSTAAQLCAASGVPMVMLNRVAEHHALAVTCDNLAGGEYLADLLVRAGHRRFGVLTGPGESSTARDRERGFALRLAEHGQGLSTRIVAGPGEPQVTTYAGGYEAGLALADLPARERPDAVLAISDIMAIGAIDALRERGLSVPGHLSVVGFDGIPEGARPPYGLTTIRQPVEAMVRRGLELLASAATAGGAATILLPGEPVLRRSARLSSGPVSD
nr:substrate-binding domain-containing protein [Roseomonas marmotae]